VTSNVELIGWTVVVVGLLLLWLWLRLVQRVARLESLSKLCPFEHPHVSGGGGVVRNDRRL
jgi:hypothetical protein